MAAVCFGWWRFRLRRLVAAARLPQVASPRRRCSLAAESALLERAPAGARTAQILAL